MIDPVQFPQLTPTNHRVTSPPSPIYNCIAWCIGDTKHWWEPGSYWPVPEEDQFDLESLRRALSKLGFQDAADAALESGFERIALYSNGSFYTHAALQLASGKWSSKLGSMEDIEHDTPECIAGGVYGRVEGFMKRRA